MSHSGQSAGESIKHGLTSFHGLGETIRGNINQFVDKATFTDGRSDKNREITERGIEEMETGRYHGTSAGVTPADTTAEKVNGSPQGEMRKTMRGSAKSHHA